MMKTAKRVDLLPPQAAAENAHSSAYRRCLEIRRVVFVVGQDVPSEIEFDGLDADARHFLAYPDTEATNLKDALGTARMRVVEGDAKAERIGVLESARGLGIGRDLVLAIEAHARKLGLPRVRLNAQLQAAPFYEKLGYVPYGEVFVEADIDHRAMKKRLD